VFVEGRTVQGVDPTIACLFASCEELGETLETRLWDSRDEQVRCALASRPRVSPELEELIFAEASSAVRSAWAGGSRRSAGRLLQLLSTGPDELTARAVAGQEFLGSDGIDAVLALNPGNLVCERLLDRSDLTPRQRARAVDGHLAGATQLITGSLARIPAARIGEGVDAWIAALRHADRHHGLLGNGPHRDDPRVQDATLTALESLAAAHQGGLDPSSQERAAARAAEWLISSATLSRGRALRLQAVAAVLAPSLVESVRDRAELDVEGLLAALDCPSGGRPEAGAGHAEKIVVLTGAVGRVELPLRLLALEALVHWDELPAGTPQAVMSKVYTSQARMLLQEVEKTYGIASLELVRAVQELGVMPSDSLTDPVPALVTLAGQGWKPVRSSAHVPERARAQVATALRPVRDAVADPAYRAVIAAHVSALESALADTTLGLIGEWDGSFEELLNSARALLDSPASEPAGSRACV
jgi:hypothetical protein